ncbi:response regulator receiver protein [Beutenbergia cavernae DSM 12333]|uniref:Response regulator receiver protein n=1 Tax=Beutenbergia cavernae (strain ATCC BAA-8 / DSM 12333 / CCUG 43141 / JCM 11478 / NBRC 16432 / NCIMB 13614 / HKI 0122) TaxID=471853 RepID=C5C5F8_BEUC1|nr:response regulator transcription factor [Beutenbergia cavernae]ACQ80149.1 response regulator receiver protein [Beutenbergia cavernae DSM 12333]
MTLEHAQPTGSAPEVASTLEEPAQVLLYSDDRATRDAVRLAVGRRASVDTARIAWTESATAEATLAYAAAQRFDLLVLDGEAAKVGGMGISRQLKNEIYDCPPVLVLTARPQDAWLAAWSEADGVVSHPLRPVEVAEAVAALLRAGERSTP